MWLFFVFHAVSMMPCFTVAISYIGENNQHYYVGIHLIFCDRTTHEFLFGALAELLDNARYGSLCFGVVYSALFDSMLLYAMSYSVLLLCLLLCIGLHFASILLCIMQCIAVHHAMYCCVLCSVLQ